MHVNVGFGDVLLNELVGTAEETLDVLSGVVWDQNTKVFDVGVDKKVFFSKNRDNGTNLQLFKVLLVLCQLDIT